MGQTLLTAVLLASLLLKNAHLSANKHNAVNKQKKVSMSINPPTDFIQEKENMCYLKQKCSTGMGCCFKACHVSSLTQGMEKDMDQGCDMQGTPLRDLR